MSASLQRLLSAYGLDTIHKIQMCRVPLSNILEVIINVLSFNQLNRIKKKLSIDKLFHLYCYIHINTTDGLKCVLIEKDEVIKVADACLNRNNSEIFDVSNYDPDSLTVDTLFRNAIQFDGLDNFVTYSADYNNCQRFQLTILSGSNLLTQSAESFILQPADVIFDKLPWMYRYLAKKITDLAAVYSRAIGKGFADEYLEPFKKKVEIGVFKKGLDTLIPYSGDFAEPALEALYDAQHKTTKKEIENGMSFRADTSGPRAPTRSEYNAVDEAAAYRREQEKKYQARRRR